MSSKVKIKKPPDINKEDKKELNEQVYRTIKCPLKSILKQCDKLQPIIEQCVKDINEIVILAYQFIRLYLLNKFTNNKELPNVNKQFILDVLKTVSSTVTTKGKQKSENKISNKEGKDDIKLFYNDVFYKLVNKKLSYSNKTFILDKMADEMLRCIETNISTHFLKHLFKFINCKFKKPKTIDIKKEKDKSKRKELYKELNNDIRNLKSDIIDRQILDSKEEYHQWIKDNVNLILPEKFTKSIPYDIKANPTKYIKYSMYINNETEKLGAKPYAFIPQRNNIIMKNIVLNTSGITDLISSKYEELFNYKKSNLILNCKKYQSHIWSKILKLEKQSIFNNKNYTFYHQIITDGFNCCLLFILKKYKNKKFGDKIPKYKENDDEFIKLNGLTKDECNRYLNGNYKFISNDPGVNCPLNLIDEENNFFQYSNCRRRVETYTKRTKQIIQNEKEKKGIVKKETKLSKFNSRTLNPKEYEKFIVQKTKTNNEVKDFYNNILFRKLNFRRFVYTLQSEQNLLNEIENKYLTKEDTEKGKKILIFYGNYSRTINMKNKMPTPGIGIKRLIASRFEILETDEFRTSKLYNKTFKELINVKVRKGKHSKKLHQVLTPKEETEKCIRVNRDKNACMNILHLGKYYLENQSRPKEFQREKEKIQIKKAIKLTTKINKNNKKQITV